MLIGLTGGIAAGKSTVSRLLAENGCFIVDADITAHEVLRLPKVISKLTDTFGSSILDDSGNIDRHILGKLAFSASDGIETLDRITHPAIYHSMLTAAREAEAAYRAVVLDAALLIESGLYRECDTVWLVCANTETQYARIMKRDGLTRSESAARLSSQMPERHKRRYANVIIENNSDFASLRIQVENALNETLNTARS